MRKYLVSFLMFSLLLAAGFVVIGCGQVTPTISTVSSQPVGLTIRGTVYGTVLRSPTLPTQPLSGVVLYLSGDQVSKVTSTDANGQYAFTGLPSNNTGSGNQGYNIVANKEGYQRRMQNNLNFGSNIGAPVPDNSVLTQDIMLVAAPVVLSISPTPGTTIEAGAKTIVVEFNEAMDQVSVRPTLVAQGMRTFADTQTLTSTWSADSKTLYISTGALLANKFYRFSLDPGVVAKDVAGNLLDAAGGTASMAGGLSNVVYNSVGNDTDYRTAAGGAPGAPTGVLLTVNQKATFDFADVNGGGEPVDLSWLAPASGVVAGYNIYVSNGASGPWALLAADSPTNFNNITSSVLRVNTALYGAMTNADCIKQMAFVTDPIYFKVAAFNAEGETSATVVSTRDATGPTILVADRTPATANVPNAVNVLLTDYGPAGANQNLGAYVQFSEPMNLSSLTDATKYTILGGINVTSATVVYSGTELCIVRLTFDAAITPGVTTVTASASSGPTDLSGNVSQANAVLIN